MRRKQPSYLVQFRFHGYAKKYARSIIWDVARKFKVKGITHKKVVPHLTLFGPFTTKDRKRMVSTFIKTVKRYHLVPFKVKGFNCFNNVRNKVIYLNIQPSKRLVDLRKSLATNMLKCTTTKSMHDKKVKFHFHATVAFKDIDRKFKKIWSYIQKQEEPEINQHLLRVTLLRGNKILYEYDLIQGRLLGRKQALNKGILKKTFRILKSKGIQFEDEFDRHLTLWEKIKSIFI
jgi:2'-5' RNA ligase